MDGLSGSINNVFNKDKSSTKQLKWEAKKREDFQGKKSSNKISDPKFKQGKKYGRKTKSGRNNVKRKK